MIAFMILLGYIGLAILIIWVSQEIMRPKK